MLKTRNKFELVEECLKHRLRDKLLLSIDLLLDEAEEEGILRQCSDCKFVYLSEEIQTYGEEEVCTDCFEGIRARAETEKALNDDWEKTR